jgi:quinone-modifying oxidoreductase, subunit QmoA
MNLDAKPILVIGGGIAGITAALEAAEVGYKVVLVEKEPYLGGRVSRTYRYFPKMCPPTCGLEINTRRIRNNPRITVYTMANVEELSGSVGDFKAKIKVRPRYVTGNCSLDATAADQISSERSNDFNLGLDKTKALYMPFDMAYPAQFVLDKEALSKDDEAKLMAAVPEGAIDLNMQEEMVEVEAGAIVLATGWSPYDATKMDNLGYGQCKNVITNAIMERLASSGGPTGGEIVRPSDSKKPENIAFVQCAGSRDDNHLPYCSAVCCMGSLKQARYLREKNPDAKITIFYIDIRSIGSLENFYYDMLEDENITFIKGKVAKIAEDAGSGDLTLDVEDTLTGDKLHQQFDMVVLATGVVPNTTEIRFLPGVKLDDYGFINGEVEGVYAAGCAKRPCDVSRTTKDATGAALKAIQCLTGE